MNHYTRELLKVAHDHGRLIQQAERILSTEHGIRHEPGEHELCPKCQAMKNLEKLRTRK